MSTKRNEALINAPMSIAPKTDLATARDIKNAIARNLQGKNYGVYCFLLGDTFRVYDARTRQGALEIKTGTGHWIKPSRVYVEG